MKPATRYAKSGKVNIAYQVLGSGNIDLVYIPGWISNIDMMWACPELVYFLKELSKVARVILFDKRGTGLSDRMSGFPTLEERMDDIRAVMDAVNSEKAILFGHSEGGSVSALFAATYPNRTISLITFGIFARREYHPDYPWAPTKEERQKVYDMIEDNWGNGNMNLESLAPSKANDKKFMDWLASYFRSGASPGAALMITKLNTQVDIINILEAIKVPTLIMQRTHDIDVKIEEGKFIVDRIEGARFVALPGDDHLFWVGDTTKILQEIKTFVAAVKPTPVYEKQLFSILTGTVHQPSGYADDYQYVMQQNISDFKGSLLEQNECTFTAIFNGPTKALKCAKNLMKACDENKLRLSLGIHIKECFVDHPLCSEIEAFTAHIKTTTKPGQILVTQTVKNLLVGTDVYFNSLRSVFKTETHQQLPLFTITNSTGSNATAQPAISQKQHTFLERVLKKINAHLTNEQFGVDMLCKEIGISERQLQRKLKVISNTSPNRLILSVRLERAKQLLLSNPDSVGEIAFQAGFSNPSYFSKCFKKEYEVSPSEFVRHYS